MDGVGAAFDCNVDGSATGALLGIERVARNADVLDGFERGSVLGLVIGSHIEGARTVDTDTVIARESDVDDERQSALRVGGKGVRICWRRDTRKRDKQTLVVTAYGNWDVQQRAAANVIADLSPVGLQCVRLGRDLDGL